MEREIKNAGPEKGVGWKREEREEKGMREKREI